MSTFQNWPRSTQNSQNFKNVCDLSALGGQFLTDQLRGCIRDFEHLRRFRELECADPFRRGRHPGLVTKLAIELDRWVAELLQRAALRGTMAVGASRSKDVARVRCAHG